MIQYDCFVTEWTLPPPVSTSLCQQDLKKTSLVFTGVGCSTLRPARAQSTLNQNWPRITGEQQGIERKLWLFFVPYVCHDRFIFIDTLVISSLGLLVGLFVWYCSSYQLSTQTIVNRGDWLWKAENFKDRHKGCCSYTNLFVVVAYKLWCNKIMRRFCWSVRSKC